METKKLNSDCTLFSVNNINDLKELLAKHKGIDKIDLASIVVLPANQNFDMKITGYQVLETAKAKALQIVGDATSESGEVFKGVSATTDLQSLGNIGTTCTIQTSTYQVERNGKMVDRVKAQVIKCQEPLNIESAENVKSKSATSVKSKSATSVKL